MRTLLCLAQCPRPNTSNHAICKLVYVKCSWPWQLVRGQYCQVLRAIEGQYRNVLTVFRGQCRKALTAFSGQYRIVLAAIRGQYCELLTNSLQRTVLQRTDSLPGLPLTHGCASLTHYNHG